MSLPHEKKTGIPERTAKLARTIFPKGNKYMILRDELGEIFKDEQFSSQFSWKGATAVSPGILAMVCVMQFMENLSDQQAVEAVCSRIDWKYALGLELEDPGFDSSVLTNFRARLLVDGTEMRLLTHLLALCNEKKLIKRRGRQRTDSTHVLMAARTVNRLELVGETLRFCLEDLAEMTPEWLRSRADPAWFRRYGQRMEQARFPTDKTERDVLCLSMGKDGYALLTAIYSDTETAHLRNHPTVETLRQVWVQEFYREDGTVFWRQAGNLPSGTHMINSPQDVEARYSEKQGHSWVGYKDHITETCDPHFPHLIVHVETTPAPVPDCVMVEPIHQALAQKELLPGEHVLDGGYVDIENMVNSQKTHQVTLVGPMRQDYSWQARTQTGYDLSRFQVDWEAQRVTCPQGKASQDWFSRIDAAGKEEITVRFDKQECAACPVRNQCTRSAQGARSLHLQAQPYHDLLQQMRQDEANGSLTERYKIRAGIEGTISLAVRAHDLRFSRYLGLAKTRMQNIFTAIAINLSRLADWFPAQHQGLPVIERRARTRTSRLTAMAPA